MAESGKIDPPIFVSKKVRVTSALSTVGQVIDFVQRGDDGKNGLSGAMRHSSPLLSHPRRTLKLSGDSRPRHLSF